MPAKKARPPGWGKDFVLERIEAGDRVGVLCAALAKEHGCSSKTLKDDIQTWRKTDEGFRVRWVAAMEVNFGRVPAGGRPRGAFDEEAQEAFLAELAINGGRIAPAAEKVGVAVAHVYHKINPENREYDSDFAHRVAFFEGTRFANIREGFLDEAANGNAWAAQKALETGLPHLHNPKREVRISGTLKHEHTLAPAVMEQVVARRQLFFERSAAARAALPAAPDESRVIDVTPVRVAVEAGG